MKRGIMKATKRKEGRGEEEGEKDILNLPHPPKSGGMEFTKRP